MSEPVATIMAVADFGSRLGVPVPKALVELSGMSLVRRSVLTMCDGGVRHMVVTIPEGCLLTFEATPSRLDGIICVVGGTERQDSVRLGLDMLSECFDPETIVLIHDAARPLVPPQVITAILHAMAHGVEMAIPVVAVHDSTRQVGSNGSRIVDRSILRTIQAPQGIRLGLLREAYKHVARYGLAITDDASTIEALGHHVILMLRHHDTLKVIEQLDLVLARGILDGRSQV